MKRLWAIAAGVAALVTAAAGIGLMIARRLTAPTEGRRYDLVIREVREDDDQRDVVLDRNRTTATPGIYNLWLEGGGWVRLGGIVEDGATTVTRPVLAAMPETELRVGARASWSGIYYRDPADAGLNAVDIAIPTAFGSAPAWLIQPSVRGDGDWAIHIHGLGSPRAGTLRGVGTAAQLGLTSLVVTYRNDGDGSTLGSGRNTLGARETDDVRAAVTYALDHGARRIVLFGWSMGAAIALQLAADAELRSVVDGVVLDSPVLDWGATINANCARAGWPGWFGLLALPWLESAALARLIGLPTALPLERFDWIRRAAQLDVATLILHGVDDTSVPFAVSRQLARLRPDVVRLERFNADHTMSWNSDPQRWELIVGEWLQGRATRG